MSEQAPQRRRLTDCDAVTSADNENLGQGDLADGFGGFREATVEIAEPPVLYRPRKPKKGEKRNKLLVRFVGKRKAWICGPASRKVIKAMYGRYLETWVGKRITLYVDPNVMFGKSKTGGIRVRPLIPGGQLTEDPLDNPPDEEREQLLEEAAEQAFADDAPPPAPPARQPGQEG